MSTYAIGSKVHLTAQFQDAVTKDRIDPTSVSLQVKDPADFTTTYTPIRDSLGNYHYDIDATIEGEWFYRFASEGTGQAAKERSFLVDATEFA